MRIIGVLLLLMTIVLAVSCGDDDETTTGPAGIPFSLTITVVDISGNPVPDLRVSGWSTIGSPAAPKAGPGQSASGDLASTALKFDVKQTCDLTYFITDMAGTMLDTIVNALTESGQYTALWDAGDYRDGVYALSLTAKDSSSGAVLFSDTKLAVLYGGQASGTNVPWGYTDLAGQFSTSDSLMFPTALPLSQPLIEMDYSGIETGTFEFLDTVFIALADTVTLKIQNTAVVVEAGANEFALVWDPAKSPPVPPDFMSDPVSKGSQPSAAGMSVAPADTAWFSLAGNIIRVDSATVDMGGFQLIFDDSVDASLTANTSRMSFTQLYDGSVTRVTVFPYMHVDSVKCFSSGDVLQLSGAANVVHTDVSTCDTILNPQVMQVVWPGTPEWKLYQNYPNPFF